MADEEVVETEPTRELTLEEAHKPVIDIMGQQAVGAVDLGQGKIQPQDQQIQTEELLSSQGLTLDPTQRAVTAQAIAKDPQGFRTTQQETPANRVGLGEVDAVSRTFTSLPTEVQAPVGAVGTGAIVDANQVVDERTKQQMLERGSLAEAKTQTLAQEATVQFQIESLYESLEEGKPLPAWASANVRKVQEIMNARGLGDSSIAAAAMVQAIAESALPIAAQDANKFATIQLANLTNEQQTALSNAATISAMDKQNLDNKMKAAQQNAQSFLAMDMKNVSNEQQTALLNFQTKVQSLFTDTAAENARLQFNAKSETQVNEFYDQLGVTVAKYNADREVAMHQIEIDQANSVAKFNAKLTDARDKVNTNLKSIIDQSNSVWRRQINTANTSEQNRANQLNAAAVLGITTSSLANLWQEYRDEASFSFTTSENLLQRNQQLALTAISNQFAESMFEAQVDADNQKSMGVFLGRLLENSFAGAISGLTDFAKTAKT